MSDHGGTLGGRWMVDPTGQHELRWFDGVAFTDYVSDNGHQLLHPLTGKSEAAIEHSFAGRKKAWLRLIAAIAAILAGAALTIATLTSSSSGPVLVLSPIPFLWGGVEIVRSSRFLRRARRSPESSGTAPAIQPPPPVAFEDQVQVLDDMLRRGRLSTESHAMARRRLARQFGHTLEPDDEPG